MTVHLWATRMFSLLLVGLGTAILVRTALLGGGVGFGLGAIVLAAGAGRLYFSRARRER